RRPSWATERWRCSLRGCGCSPGCGRDRASSPRGRRCRESVSGRRRSRPAPAGGRNAPASPRPAALRSATRPSNRDWPDATAAGSESDCCWRSALGGHTGGGSPNQSIHPAPCISRPPPKNSARQPILPIVGSIPKRLADLANRAEIVMGVQQLLETPLLALPDRANPDLPKLQVPCPARPLRRPSFIARTNPIVQIYRQPSGRPRRLNRGQFTVAWHSPSPMKAGRMGNMGEITIRPAQPADAQAIARLDVETWRTTYAGVLSASYLIGLSERRREIGWRSVILR